MYYFHKYFGSYINNRIVHLYYINKVLNKPYAFFLFPLIFYVFLFHHDIILGPALLYNYFPSVIFWSCDCLFGLSYSLIRRGLSEIGPQLRTLLSKKPWKSKCSKCTWSPWTRPKKSELHGIEAALRREQHSSQRE